MKNLLSKIMQSRYKYCIIAVIIMVIVFILGTLIIVSMSNMVVDGQVDYTDFTVVDKHTGDNHSYIIVSDQNETFDLPNDNFGHDIYDNIQIGKHYKFTTEKNNGSITTHIIQVNDG